MNIRLPNRASVAAWNETARAYPPLSVHELFDAQAVRDPEAAAIRRDADVWSYRDLRARADAVAARLHAAGVGSESLVGICLERSPALIAALLGVLKAGAAYVPLDPEYPLARLHAIVQDTGMTLVLADARTRATIAAVLGPDGLPVTIVDLDDQTGELTGDQRDAPAVAAPAPLDQLAYVIYTSGSTGTPKGVAVTHRGLTNYVCWCLDAYDVAGGRGAALHTPLGFDLTVTSIFPVLAAGRCIHLAPAADDVATAMEVLRGAADLSLFKVTPSHLEVLARQLTPDDVRGSTRVLVVGGEALHTATLTFWREASPETRVINEYGPTETVVGACTYEAGADLPPGPVPIGRPIANTQVYVLDDGVWLTARGDIGELCIGGAGLARGYWRRPGLTAERFVPNPSGGTPGERLYRSGDLVRWRDDDQLEFLGRADHQVKIRGHRVELGDIESTLLTHPAIRAAAVIARQRGDGRPQLTAYVVAQDSAAPGTAPGAAIRAFLRERLAEYMVPAGIVLLDAMPLTIHGKADRDALAVRLDVPGDGAAAAAAPGVLPPRTPLEELLAGIVADVLERDGVDIHESFFDLGGDSLQAVQAAWRVGEACAAEVSLQMLFETPSVAALAAVIEAQLGTGARPPVLPIDRRERLPLSYAQQRLWFLHEAAPDSSAYHVPLAIRLRGALDVDAVRDSLDAILARHEVLRTGFVNEGGAPVLCIEPSSTTPIRLVDTTEAAMPELIAAECQCAFDLSSPPLFRVTLFRLAPDDHVLLIVLHHIATDGWSTGILIEEFAALYGAYAAGEIAPLPALPIQYVDYASWQREWLERGEGARQLAYWREKLAGPLPALMLPFDRPRPQASAPAQIGTTLGWRIAPDVSAGLRRLCRTEGATLFMTLLAGLATLLSRYSGETDLLVGSAVAGRSRAETAGLAGFFVNLLALRVDLAGSPSFREVIGRVRQTALEAYAHQDVPFEQLVEDLHPHRDLTRQPLFSVLFSVSNAPQPARDLGGLRIERATTAAVMAKYDLTITAAEDAAGIALRLEYANELFDRETIERFAGHWERLLAAMAQAPDNPVTRLDFLDDAERVDLLTTWNRTARDLGTTPVHALIARQAALVPTRDALICGSQRLSHAELRRRVRHLAKRLRAEGVGPDRIVAIFMDRSAELVVALLAILEAGGAYLPLNVNDPAPRLALTLEDARPVATIVQPSLVGRLPPGGGARLMFGRTADGVDVEGESDASPDQGPVAVLPDHLAYVIYTSGSTGVPKGVAITHRGFANYVAWAIDTYDVAGGSGTALHTSLSVDLTVTSLFPALAAGRCVWVAGPGDEASITVETVRGLKGLSLLKLTPSHVQLLRHQLAAGELGGARALVIGGEALHAETLAFWRAAAPDVRLFNEYGPTETVVGGCIHEIAGELPAGAIPIGLPIANMRAHVLDREVQLCPIGAAGELYLEGVGVARGYVRRPGLTAQWFVPHPFATAPGERLYRTGDLVRRRADGVLEYLGRGDAQVKIRGYRVDVAEIEAALLAQPDVAHAAVLADTSTPSPAGTRLTAYVAPRANASLVPAVLRQALAGRLPGYMVPAAFVLLDALPLTRSGKVDRSALAHLTAPVWTQDGPEYVAPRTPFEQVLAGIWADALRCERVGRHDDFFQLGGHSLLAARVAWRASEALGMHVPLQVLLQHPTVAALAECLDTAAARGGELWPAMTSVSRGGDLPLSYAQQRLWFLDQLEPGSSAYNVPIAIRVRGPLDEAALRRSFEAIAARHEVLRTSFPSVGGQPVQRIADGVEIDIRLEPRAADLATERVTAIIAGECARAFDLQHAPLLRLTLVRLAPDEHVLVLVLHHIVCDGWSMDVLAREFAEHYRADVAGERASLPALQVQYADYAAWQRAWLEGGELDRQLGYWAAKLASPPPRLQLGLEPSRDTLARSGASVACTWRTGLVEDLRRLGREESCTLNMTLIAGLTVLLHAYTAQTDVVIGIDIAGRRRAETESLIGFFVNQLAIRTEISPRRSFRDHLREVRKTTLDAYAHQDVPFDRLVAALGTQTRDGRQSLFNVKLTMRDDAERQEMGEPCYQVGPLRLDVLGTDDLMPKLDLLFEVLPRGAELVVRAQFDLARFARGPIEMMLDLYRTCLSSAADAPDASIGDLVQRLALARQALGETAHERIKQSWATGHVKRRALVVPGL